MGTEGPILLFDGLCNLCNATVQFVLKRDPKRILRFASLQSEAGKRLTAGRIPEAELLRSFLLFDGEVLHFRSDAALEVAKRLSGLWPLLRFLRVIPRPVRDRIYDWVARNRYRWFGKLEECPMPTPELRDRFLD